MDAMLVGLIYALIVLLVLAAIYWVANLGVTAFGLPAIVLQIIGAILGLVFLLFLLRLVLHGPVKGWPW